MGVAAAVSTATTISMDSDVWTRVNIDTNNTPPWARSNQTASSVTCRCYPGDDCWPSLSTWDAFNRTIGGRLIATVPLAAACHDSTFGPYDAGKCASLKAAWFTPQPHLESPSSIMESYFTNNSCNPFVPRDSPCTIGPYVSYSVNVSGSRDVSRTLWFVTYFNIRIVIKNTGHDYNGKSTGAGAIGIWTHNLDGIDFINYRSANYTGKAIKVGAGVQVVDAYAAASAQGLAIVGGECPTVGYAGGYTQGGGHSALSSKYGLAADQVLEWEVTDGRGRLLKASPSANENLYWALCGGGGGTFGVVISMTSKAYPDVPVTGATISFTNAGVSQDQFYHVLETFHASLPSIVDSGATTVTFFTNETFALSPLTGPDLSPGQVDQLILPLSNQLKRYNMSYNYNVTEFPGYFQQFSYQSTPGQVGLGLYGGRFISRFVVENNNTQLGAAYRYINERGGTIATIGLNVSRVVTGNVWNAVSVAWRDTLIETVIQMPYNETATIEDSQKSQDQITHDLLPRLEQLTPGGGAYLSESDFQQPEWQKVFYGSNYDTLNAIKDLYDPFHIFYATTAVGSEYWAPQADGRLCKV